MNQLNELGDVLVVQFLLRMNLPQDVLSELFHILLALGEVYLVVLQSDRLVGVEVEAPVDLPEASAPQKLQSQESLLDDWPVELGVLAVLLFVGQLESLFVPVQLEFFVG